MNVVVSIMRLEQLQQYIEIVKYNSISLASEKMYIAPQTLSLSVKLLEQEIGSKLFERSYKGVSLTKEGEIFYKFAVKVVAEYNIMLNALAPEKNLISKHKLNGQLTVYSNPIFNHTFLPKIIFKFWTDFPDVKLTLHIQDTIGAIDQFEEKIKMNINALSLVLLTANQKELISNNPFFKYTPLVSGNYVACVSKQSPLAQYKCLSLETILKNKIVLMSPENPQNTTFYQIISQYATPIVSISTDNFRIWIDAVQSNKGVGFLHEMFFSPSSLVSDELNNIIKIQIKEDIKAEIGYLSSKNHSELVQEFINRLPSWNN